MSAEQRYLSIISGQSRGVGAAAARVALRLASPVYCLASKTRNSLFNNGLKASHSLGRPTISVGNITTGGTGKTPVVQWLANRLIRAGEHPAVLLRGYKSKNGLSDEAELLKQPGVEVEANPDRVAGAQAVLARRYQTSIFLLDDGFQHRRAARDFDLVLIDATNPFGHDHLLPRGLLRESPSSLSRASAILITRADAVEPIDPLLARIREYAPAAPIFQSRHTVHGLIDVQGNPVAPDSMGKCLAVAGIGNPQSFLTGLAHFGLTITEMLTPGDHHAYTDADLSAWRARSGSFDTLVVTEKDWVKLKHLKNIHTLKIARAVLAIDFADDHEESLWGLIVKTLGQKKGRTVEG